MEPTCLEPTGNEPAGYDGLSKHDAMIDQVGQCPWCGESA